jgi:choline dehydrogenase
MKVYTRTRAQRILFDQNTANGVEVVTENWTYYLHAREEVVLSAGAFNSPSLLM